jgi:subtilisin family serine protease
MSGTLRPATVGHMRARLLIPIVLGMLVVVVMPPAAQAAKAVSGQLIVGFERKVSSDRQRAVLKKLGAKAHKRLPHIRAAAVRPRSGLALSVLRRRLAKHPAVDYVERDYILQRSLAPNDPMLGEQSALAAAGPGTVDAQTAWNKRTTCSKVAVLDTGMQYTHPDLKENVWHNKHEVDDNGKDDDKNGYVDDYYGLNAIAGKGNAEDKDGHGTHVSGIIGARGNNALGVSGLCWQATIMPVKFMNSKGQGSTSDAVAGLEYAIQMGAKIINNSWGGTAKSQSLANEIGHAEDKGVLLVVAAGNNSQDIDKDPFYPADYTNGNILCVAAITATGSLASFSDFGAKQVDLGAPGNDIVSTYPTSTYKVLSGTSMATPFVTAAAAMLRQQNNNLTYSKLRSLIKDHVVANPALAGKTVTGGQLDLAAALAAAG